MGGVGKLGTNMITIPAKTILDAIDSGDIESIRDDGLIVVLIDFKRVLTLPALPTPQVSKSPGNVITVLSGDVIYARIVAESPEDAEAIAATLADLLAMV